MKERTIMRTIALGLAILCTACMQRGRLLWGPADLAIPQPCTSAPTGDPSAVWSDSLPIVADTARQQIVGGSDALVYPEAPRLANRPGLVRARFVIDTLGRVLPGSAIIEASNDVLFSQAVCEALPRLTFAPVVIDGHKAVAGFVHVPFSLYP
jgi:outer membrane biosynthesis protein TonB